MLMKKEKSRCAMDVWKNGWPLHLKFKNRLEKMRPCTDAADVAPCIKVESNGTYLREKNCSICRLNSHFFARKTDLFIFVEPSMFNNPFRWILAENFTEICLSFNQLQPMFREGFDWFEKIISWRIISSISFLNIFLSPSNLALHLLVKQLNHFST